MAIRVAFIMLIVFFTFSMTSALSTLWLPVSSFTLPLSLVRSDYVIFEIGIALQNKRSLPDWWIVTAEILHPGNAAVLRELGLYENKFGHFDTALLLLQKAIALEPKNLQNFVNYITVKERTPRPVTLTDEVTMLSKAYLNNSLFQRVVRGFREYPPKAEEIIGNRTFDLTRIHVYSVEGILAMSFYIYGASLLDSSRDGVVYWWDLASETDPGMSRYANAESSFRYQEMHDSEGAKEAFKNCTKDTYARTSCDERTISGMTFPYWYYHFLLIPYLPLTP